MKRYLWSIGLGALSLLASCRQGAQEQTDSQVEVSVAAEATLNVRATKAAEYVIPVPSSYRYELRRTGGELFSAGVLDGLIDVPQGGYTIEVSSIDSSGTQPSYRGSSTLKAERGKTTSVAVTAKLLSAVVKVGFSEAITSSFVSYRVVVWGADASKTVVFDGSKTDLLAYFSAPLAALNYRVEVTTEQGRRYSHTDQVTALKAADLFDLLVDINTTPEVSTDPMVLGLTLHGMVNQEEVTRQVAAEMEGSSVPTITGREIDLSQPVGVEYLVGSEVKIDLGSKGKLGKVLFMFRAGQKPLEGFEGQSVIDVMELSLEERTALGVEFETGGVVGESLTSLVDLSKMSKMLPGTNEGSEDFYLTIGVLDQNGQYTAREVTFNVYGVPLMTLDYLYADQIDWFGQHGPINRINARLHGTYNTSQMPDGLVFEYRRQGQSAWQVLEPLVDPSTPKRLYAVLTMEADGAQWEYRLSSPDNSGLTVQLPVLPSYPLYSNLSLDAWGGGTRANPDNWSSPNYDGVLGIGVVNSTSRQTGRTGAGYAARIVSGDAAGQFASGGLFTGSMKVDMNAPYKSAQVGKPFSGRPKKLVGYFKYKANNIHRLDVSTLPGNGAKNGEPDMCEIAVKLERWDGGNYSIRWRDGFFGNPGSAYWDSEGVPVDARAAQVVDYDGNGSGPLDVRKKINVGYGKLTSRGQADWTRFEIDIEYSQDIMPDRLIITAVSSAWGGYMSGAEGSELWVDDLEFVY